VLEVQEVQIPPITAAEDPTGGCTFTITEATATLNNVPKSENADTSPANDILVTDVTISYDWDDGFVTLPFHTSPRVVIPAAGSGQVRFVPMPIDALISAATARDGHSAELTILFTGVAADGEGVQALGGAPMIVNSCIPTAP
jgi:hypothetical protein